MQNKSGTVSEAKLRKETTNAKAAHTLSPRIKKRVSNMAVANATRQVNKDGDNEEGVKPSRTSYIPCAGTPGGNPPDPRTICINEPHENLSPENAIGTQILTTQITN